MAWPDFSLTDTYTSIITKLNTGFTNVAKLFRDQATGDLTNQIRYNSTDKRLEYWTGAAWAALALDGTPIVVDSTKLNGKKWVNVASSSATLNANAGTTVNLRTGTHVHYRFSVYCPTNGVQYRYYDGTTNTNTLFAGILKYGDGATADQLYIYNTFGSSKTVYYSVDVWE